MSSPVEGLTIEIAAVDVSQAALTTARDGIASLGVTAKESSVQVTAAMDRAAASVAGPISATQKFGAAAKLAAIEASTAMQAYQRAMTVAAAEGSAAAIASVEKFQAAAVVAAARSQEAMAAFAASSKTHLTVIGEHAQSTFKSMASGLTGALAIGVGFGIITEAFKAAEAGVKGELLVDYAFGPKQAEEVKKAAEAAAPKFGLSAAQFNTSAANTGRFLSGTGVAGDEASRISIELAGREADLAKTTGKTTLEVEAAVTSALRGRGLALKSLGVDINATNLMQTALTHGIVEATVNQDKVAAASATYGLALQSQEKVMANAKSTAADKAAADARLVTAGDALTKVTEGSVPKLNDQQKALAGTQFIMDATAKSAGAFAKSSTTLAGQQVILKATMENLADSLGKALIPLLTQIGGIMVAVVVPAVKLLGSVLHPVLEFFQSMPDWVQKAIAGLGIFLLLKGPLMSMFDGIVNLAKSLFNELMNVGTGAGAAAGGLDKLGKMLTAGAIIGGAILIISTMGDMTKALEDAKKVGESLANSIEDALIASNGKWTDSVQKSAEAGVAQTDQFKALIKHGADYHDAMTFLTGGTVPAGKAMGDLAEAMRQTILAADDPGAFSKWIEGAHAARSEAEQFSAAAIKAANDTQNANAETHSENMRGLTDADKAVHGAGVATRAEYLANAAAQTAAQVLYEAAWGKVETAIDSVTSATDKLNKSLDTLPQEAAIAMEALNKLAGITPSVEQAVSTFSSDYQAAGASRGLGTATPKKADPSLVRGDGSVNLAAPGDNGTQLYTEVKKLTEDALTVALSYYEAAGGGPAGEAQANAMNLQSVAAIDSYLTQAVGAVGAKSIEAHYGIDPKTFLAAEIKGAQHKEAGRATGQGALDKQAQTTLFGPDSGVVGQVFAMPFEALAAAMGAAKAEGGWITGGSGVRDDVPLVAMDGEFITKRARAMEWSKELEYMNTHSKSQQAQNLPYSSKSAGSPVANLPYRTGGKSVSLAPGAIVVNIDAQGRSAPEIAQLSAVAFREQLVHAFTDDVDRSYA